MTTDSDSHDTLRSINAKAHHALGQMYGAPNVTAFAEAVRDFVEAIGEIVTVASRFDDTTNAVVEALAAVERHPLRRGVRIDSRTRLPVVYVSRIARGSDLPPFKGAPLVMPARATGVLPEDYFFEDADKRPAIELCSDYLTRVDRLVDGLTRARE